MKHIPMSFVTEPKTMEEAILAGKKTFQEFPQMGTEQFLIKVEVCAWLWRQARAIRSEQDTVPGINEKVFEKIFDSMAVLDLMTRITK